MASRDTLVAVIKARAVPGAASEILIVEGDNQESEVELPVPVSPRIQVRDSYGNGVAGLSVSFRGGGGSVANPSESVTDTGGFAAVDQWILGAREGLSYRLTAHVSDGDQPVGMIRFTATATPSVYDIVIVHADSSALSEGQLEAFAKAEEFWEKAIQGNLGWSTLKKPDLERCLSLADIDYEVPGDRVVDDLLIYADVREIDGLGGIYRGSGPLPDPSGRRATGGRGHVLRHRRHWSNWKSRRRGATSMARSCTRWPT